MASITLVSGNKNKLKEILSIAPSNLKIEMKSIDLDEIQSLDLRKIVEDKVRRAYDIVKGPVIVEDVSAGLDGLSGLPGPFCKFFEITLGAEILLKLAGIAGSNDITIECLASYYDGEKMLFGHGKIHGKAVEARGKNGFGFDPVVLPDGYRQTMGEMQPDNKLEMSHRGQAIRELFAQLS